MVPAMTELSQQKSQPYVPQLFVEVASSHPDGLWEGRIRCGSLVIGYIGAEDTPLEAERVGEEAIAVALFGLTYPDHPSRRLRGGTWLADPPVGWAVPVGARLGDEPAAGEPPSAAERDDALDATPAHQWRIYQYRGLLRASGPSIRDDEKAVVSTADLRERIDRLERHHRPFAGYFDEGVLFAVYLFRKWLEPA